MKKILPVLMASVLAFGAAGCAVPGEGGVKLPAEYVTVSVDGGKAEVLEIAMETSMMGIIQVLANESGSMTSLDYWLVQLMDNSGTYNGQIVHNVSMNEFYQCTAPVVTDVNTDGGFRASFSGLLTRYDTSGGSAVIVESDIPFTGSIKLVD